MLIADIAPLLWPASGERAGEVAASLDRQCERLRDEGLLGLGALSEAGHYDNENEYFPHHIALGSVSRLGRDFLAFIEDPRAEPTRPGSTGTMP